MTAFGGHHDLAASIRRIVLEQSKRAGVGHIGSALSIADVVAALYTGPLADVDPDDADRERFVLSKGHAALAVYAALAERGVIDAEQLSSYCGDGGLLGTHPDHMLRGIDFSTGSLGQGLCFAVGASLAARVQGSARRVFVLLSDGECNEGAVWEAAMFAAQQQLSNLVAIVDANGQQAFGYTADVVDLEPLAERWTAFGWDAIEVDGHDVAALRAALAALETTTPGQPHVLVARTTFGKGVSFMEGRIDWHYLPMSDAEYDRARVETAFAGAGEP